MERQGGGASEDERGCFSCGEDGHLSRDCPTKGEKEEEEEDQSQGAGACYICGQAGHGIVDCPATKRIPTRQRRRRGAASLSGHAAVRATTQAKYLNTPEAINIANRAHDSNQNVIKWTKIADLADEGSAHQKLADRNCFIARRRTFDYADEVQEMVIAKEQRTFGLFAGTSMLASVFLFFPPL